METQEMEIQKIISNLLRTRKEKVKLLRNVQRNLTKFQQQLSRLNTLAINSTPTNSDFPKEFTRAAKDIKENIGDIKKEVREIDRTLQHLIKRFENPTINIGVIGKSGQGKSTLLQRISGLTDEVIPSSSGEPCTGAKSRIYHKEGASYAEINFYTSNEFLEEILFPYFDRLGLDRPESLEDFQKKAPHISFDSDKAYILEKELYSSLLFIRDHFDEILDCLSSSSPENISLAEIPEYVTQSTTSGKYLAVKDANIFTNFSNNDVTGLCFVDLPGLEAVKLHEKKLISSLQSEVDAIILIKCPSATRANFDNDEFQAITLIDEAVKELHLNNWSFLVLNQLSNESNKKQVEILKNDPPKGLNPAQIIAADCSDAKEVKDKIFSVVLRYVQQNLSKLDKQRVDAHINYVNEVQEKLNKLVIPLQDVLAYAAQSSDLAMQEEALVLSTDFFKRLSMGLELLVGRLQPSEEEAVKNKNKFRQAVESLCEKLESDPRLPSIEKLEEDYFVKGGWNSVVQESLHFMRSQLTRNLSTLDISLQEMVSELYQVLLSKLLPDNIIHYLLPEIENIEEKNPFEIMKSVRNLFDPEKQPILFDAFSYAIAFNFSYHSHFHYRVRQEMADLDPMQNQSSVNNLIRNEGTAQFSTQDIAKEIHNGLHAYYLGAIEEIRKKLLEELQADPSKALFALAEELKDRFIRSEGIETEWRLFLVGKKGQIWPNKFGSSDNLKKLSTEWRIVIKNAVQYANTVQDELAKI